MRFSLKQIKRIMWADKDVGRIAHGTLVVMCKFEMPRNDRFSHECVARAIELFLEELVRATLAEATAGGSLTIERGHLRAAVMTSPQFDFLRDVVNTDE